MKRNLYYGPLATLLSALILTGCSEDDGPASGYDGPGTPKFVFATSVETSAGTKYVLLTSDSLDEGTVSAVNNGCTNDGATQWVFNGNYLYGLTYNQANSGTTHRFTLGNDGQMKADPTEYFVSRFSSYGIYKNYIISMAAAENANFQANGYHPQTLTFTRIDVNLQTSTPNDVSSDNRYSLENYLGNGEYVTLAGLEPSGNRLFSGLAPMGLSQYGYADGNGKWLRSPEYRDLVATADGGTGGGSYKANSLSGTQYPDSCYVAIYSDETLTNPIIAKTNKISTPAGRFKSQYYQSVWADEKGDLYVFSPSYAKTMSSRLQRTELPAGVARIPSGSNDFDSYYCDLEEQSGGYSFMRCWYVSGPYFLLQMYDQKLTPNVSNLSATKLAIFNAETRKLTYVTGLPEGELTIGKTIYPLNGKVYIPINVTNQYPAIYSIDPASCKATKGVTIEVVQVTGMGYMEPVQ